MKIAHSSEYIQAYMQPTGKLLSQAVVTLISFLIPMKNQDGVATHSNILTVFL